jgi:hypothetical protein
MKRKVKCVLKRRQAGGRRQIIYFFPVKSKEGMARACRRELQPMISLTWLHSVYYYYYYSISSCTWTTAILTFSGILQDSIT